MAAAGAFEGYNVPTLAGARLRGDLCIIAGLASTNDWVALSKLGNQPMRGRDQAAFDNHAEYRRRFDRCWRYVLQHRGRLHYGLQPEASDEDYARFSDPLTGLPFHIHRPYIEGFRSEGDVLLPVRDDGTYGILVKHPDAPQVAAVMHPRTDAGQHQLARLPRLDGADGA
jgi:hypothetical protein